jgi:hypothetical protein
MELMTLRRRLFPRDQTYFTGYGIDISDSDIFAGGDDNVQAQSDSVRNRRECECTTKAAEDWTLRWWRGCVSRILSRPQPRHSGAWDNWYCEVRVRVLV